MKKRGLQRRVWMLLLLLTQTILVAACGKVCNENDMNNMVSEDWVSKAIVNMDLRESTYQNEYDICSDVVSTMKEYKYNKPLPEFILLVLTNSSSNKHYLYGDGYVLEMLIDGIWYTFRELPFNNTLRPLPINGSREVKVYLDWYRDVMDIGIYRIISTLTERNGNSNDSTRSDWHDPVKLVYCEFEVDA